MQEHKRIMTPTSQSSGGTTGTTTAQYKSTNDDPEFGKEHEWKRLSLMLICYILFVVALAFNSLQGAFWAPYNDLFPTPTANISYTYYTDITPTGSTFTIWIFIYIWQAVWVVYTIFCIFRRTKTGYLLYLKPDFLHYGIFIALIANWMSNITWLFLWSYSKLGWSLLFIVLIMLTLYIGLFISFRKLKENEQRLRNEGLTKDVWFTIIFLQNGLAFYATWVSIASNINFAIYMIWGLKANLSTAGTIALVLILCAIIVYFILENFVWRHYLIYIFSPWIVIIVALAGSFSNNWVASSPTTNNILTAVMIAVVVLLIIARIILFILYKTIWKQKFISFRNRNISDVQQASKESIEKA